jgi:two-component system response regulator AtoC
MMTENKSQTILIVDDEEALRNAIAFDFKRKGFTVLTAENGKRALEILDENKVALVISDIRMPGGGGLELLKEIQGSSQSRPAFILLTGFSDESEEECLALGAACIITKPFDRKKLMSSVLKALESK